MDIAWGVNWHHHLVKYFKTANMNSKTSEVAIFFFSLYLARGSRMILSAWETQKTGIAVYLLDLASIVV